MVGRRRDMAGWIGAAAAAWSLAAPAAAGPLDRSVVDPSAVWLVHIDLDAARSTPMGDVLARETQSRHGPLGRMESDLGLAPAKDLKSITVFGLPTMMSEAIVVYTTTDAADHVGEFLSKSNASSYHASTSPEGVPVHVWRTRRGESRAAVYPGRREGERLLVLARSEAELNAGVHALTSRSAGPVAGVMPAAEPREGSIVFFTSGDLNHLPGQEAPSAAILQASRSLVLDVGQSPVKSGETPRMYGHASIDTDDAASAVKVQHMAQGILALLASPREGATALPEDEAKVMDEMIRSVRIDTDEHTCVITSDHDPSLFARAMDLVMQKNAAAMKARREAARAEWQKREAEHRGEKPEAERSKGATR